MLELYAFELLQHQPTVAELTGRINVPVSTAVRWMRALEGDELITCSENRYNQSTAWVYLTPKGWKAMDGYFSAAE
jgi:DNA-binding MarR family transcriptional regulator